VAESAASKISPIGAERGTVWSVYSSPSKIAALGPLGRIAYACATHGRRTTCVWLVAIVALGAFLPQLEHSLAGSGMQASGSDSVQARTAIQAEDPAAASSALSVVIRGPKPYAQDPTFRAAAASVGRLLTTNGAVDGSKSPEQTGLISPDGRVVVVTGGAGGTPKEMIRAADDLRDRVADAAGPGYDANLSGISAQWADFNKDNRDSTLKAETYALPVTLIVLALAFGSIAAGVLPLLITVIGLAVTGGVLTLLTEVFDITLWALTFMLIFTMALGIDYALFIVMRFREALREHEDDPAYAAAVSMDTAGRAIAFSGTTVFVAVGVCFLIPSPMPRSITLAVLLSVALVMLVMFTLMPLLMARLGTRIDAGAMPWRRRDRPRRPEGEGLMYRWGAFIWRHPWPLAGGAVTVLVVLALPLGHLKIGIPAESVLPPDAPARQGTTAVKEAFGAPATVPVAITATPRSAAEAERITRADPSLVNVRRLPTRPDASVVVLQGSIKPTADSSSVGKTIDRLRDDLPNGTLVGGAPAELHDLQHAMSSTAPLVLGLILLLGSILLLVAVQAPLIALAGTLTSGLSTAAALGVSVYIFQDGHLTGLLGFQAQGFLDFWVPVFFSAMIFAIAMDYTVFFVSSAREQWDKTGDARTAVVTGMGRSGPVILAAVAAMLAVFGSFMTSTAVPAKEMGVVLGMAVLLDAFLVRLLLLPAIVRIAGRWAWWQPALLGRILPSFSLSHSTPATNDPTPAPSTAPGIVATTAPRP
jgi:RND superfamily putative drug exporter